MPVKNIIPGQHITREKLQRSRELRREMTPAEKILWQELQANKLGGRFRRQQVIAGFIVDFYCHKAALVVEVDGDGPLRPSNTSPKYDGSSVVFGGGRVGQDARREKVLSPSGTAVALHGVRDPRWGCGLSDSGMMR